MVLAKKILNTSFVAPPFLLQFSISTGVVLDSSLMEKDGREFAMGGSLCMILSCSQKPSYGMRLVGCNQVKVTFVSQQQCEVVLGICIWVSGVLVYCVNAMLNLEQLALNPILRVYVEDFVLSLGLESTKDQANGPLSLSFIKEAA
ncbi:hypothetical protein V6N13_098632 [Hibiscus sabdariffa]